MRKQTVIEHFGTAAAVAEALGISRQAVSEWGEVVPKGAAYQLQVITAGRLAVDPTCYATKERAKQ